MNSFFKLFSLTGLVLCYTLLCNAQTISPIYSPNPEANAYYTKALHYIEIGAPRAGGSPDSLMIAVALLEKAVKKDTLFTNAWGPYIQKSLLSLVNTGKGNPTQKEITS